MRLLRLRTVLVATDLEVLSDAALDSAARLAETTGATLHVIHVIAEAADGLVRTGKSPERERDVRSALDRAGVTGDPRIHVVAGDPRTTVGPLADALGADVIVMGRHLEETPGIRHAVGSTATAVIRNTLVPCLVVARPLALPFERVLIAIDASEASRGALVVAISWASALRQRAKGASPTLTALHVDDGTAAASSDQATVDRELEALRRISGDWAGVTLTGVTVSDADAVTAIARYATQLEPDLVVLGTRALGRPTHQAFGSVASTLTGQLTAPVLLVPPAVWKAYARDLVA